MKNVSILEKSKCTGCALCMNICPFNAIEMKPDEEGFLRPFINDKCTHCGLCAKKCPALSKQLNLNKEYKCFAVWGKEKFRNQGSSGGVFPILAEYVASNGGIVYGASFDETYQKVVLTKITKPKELNKLYKSKYVQSEVGLVYRDVKENLEKGKEVLFSACPCQVDALKSYLGKDYENLITIDILCHGVPSPLAYNKFLDEISNNNSKEIASVDFRDKKYGWGTLISVNFKNSETHYDLYNGNYMRAFLSGLSMREACYTCKYSQEKRVGDITLGDFWGISSYKEDWNDKKGTSFVLLNNVKGLKFFEKIKSQFERFELIENNTAVEICKKNNGAFLFPTRPNKMHKCFFKHLKNNTFSRAVRYSEKAIMDIGIVGWWIQTSRSNYGSTLTDFALYQYLGELGLSVAFISPPNFDRNNAGEFNKRYDYRMTMKYSPEQMVENNKYFDGYIVASDTLWYYDAMINQGYNFLLDFADDDKRKISYATSFGNTKRFFPDSEIPYAKFLMNKFDHVSVREFEGVDICKNVFEVDATQVMDPVFLCDQSNWEMLANNAERKTSGKFLFSYMLDPTPDKATELQKLAKKLKLKLVTVTDRQNKAEERENILKDCGIISKATIEEVVYHLKNASYIVTDSFHGFCFSLIFNKQFAVLVNRTRGASRFDTLQEIAGVGDHMFENLNDVTALSTETLTNLNYDKINKNLDIAITNSKKWLDNALNSKKENKILSTELMLGKDLYDTKKKLSKLEERLAIIENKFKN